MYTQGELRQNTPGTPCLARSLLSFYSTAWRTVLSERARVRVTGYDFQCLEFCFSIRNPDCLTWPKWKTQTCILKYFGKRQLDKREQFYSAHRNCLQQRGTDKMKCVPITLTDKGTDNRPVQEQDNEIQNHTLTRAVYNYCATTSVVYSYRTAQRGWQVLF